MKWWHRLIMRHTFMWEQTFPHSVLFQTYVCECGKQWVRFL